MSDSTEAATDRTGVTGLCDLPCPDCGERRVIYVLLTDQMGRHQHTRYICTFWRSSPLNLLCGWQGWTIPGWDEADQ